MAQAPRSSFIPKQTTSAVPSSARRRKRFHIFSLLTTLLLVASLAGAGGAYFYRDYATDQLEATKVELSEQSNQFTDADVAEVYAFDRRLDAARLLLDQHSQPSKIFDALELATMERIQFSEFGYDEGREQVTVTLSGGTEAFTTVALQELEFGKNPLLSGIVFSQLSTSGAVPDEEGVAPPVSPDTEESRVQFGITANIDASGIAFDGKTNVLRGVTPRPGTRSTPTSETAPTPTSESPAAATTPSEPETPAAGTPNQTDESS